MVGYVLGDCSLTTDAAPVISTIRRRCTCDVRQFRCAGVYVLATDIYYSNDLTCMLQSQSSLVDQQIVMVDVLRFHAVASSQHRDKLETEAVIRRAVACRQQ